MKDKTHPLNRMNAFIWDNAEMQESILIKWKTVGIGKVSIWQ